ncbi:hypothetical protein EV655_11317 [Rhodovulum euryhalinum]|uniref:Uncharacterized protein n=1 Tax=Rhodovulum euryhalinum TaxID=35805 RepID=A0A4R2KBW0_9RHOB|nr:hypothetical protein EV655_11317 [Rhodovulum euryhalinum]
MGSILNTALSGPACCDDLGTCRADRRSDAEEMDVLQLSPVAIVRAEMLAAVDELLETFRVRG